MWVTSKNDVTVAILYKYWHFRKEGENFEYQSRGKIKWQGLVTSTGPKLARTVRSCYVVPFFFMTKINGLT